jgi:hypothetical protein
VGEAGLIKREMREVTVERGTWIQGRRSVSGREAALSVINWPEPIRGG